MDFEVTCSQSLSRTATVTTNNYIPCAEDVWDDGVGHHDEWADTSDTNWADEYSECGYMTPLELIGLLKEYLENLGIHTLIHYPIPIHLQKAYASLGYVRGDFPVAETLAETELSIPLYPGMTEDEIGYVLDALNRF